MVQTPALAAAGARWFDVATGETRENSHQAKAQAQFPTIRTMIETEMLPDEELGARAIE